MTKVCMLPGKTSSNDNQFVNLLVESLEKDISVRDFNWYFAIFGSFQILHVHWPERLFRGRNWVKTFVKQILFAALLFKVKLFKVKVIYTVHNLTPHENLKLLERKCNEKFQSLVHVRVYMQPDEELSLNKRYIPHGIYNFFPDRTAPERTDRSTIKIVCIGFIRPSKNIESLIINFPEDESFSLSVAGEPVNSDYGSRLLELAKGKKNITLKLGRLSDTDLLQMYRMADIAVIPYQNTYNSGAALYALSIPVPLVATTSKSMLELQNEIGEEWLQIISQNFNSQELAWAVRELHSLDAKRLMKPKFSHERQWSSIGKEYSAIYRSCDVL